MLYDYRQLKLIIIIIRYYSLFFFIKLIGFSLFLENVNTKQTVKIMQLIFTVGGSTRGSLVVLPEKLPVSQEGVHHAAVNDAENQPYQHGRYVLGQNTREALFRSILITPSQCRAGISNQQVQGVGGGGVELPHLLFKI